MVTYGLTLIGIVAQILILCREKRRRFGWIVPAVLAALAVAQLLAGLWGWFRGFDPSSYLAGQGAAELAVSLSVRLFLNGIPALGALLVWGFFRLRRWWVKALLTVAFAAVFPFFSAMANDGGSVVYVAMTYDVTFLHKLPDPEAEEPIFRTGTQFRLFHLGDKYW